MKNYFEGIIQTHVVNMIQIQNGAHNEVNNDHKIAFIFKNWLEWGLFYDIKSIKVCK